jgi:hypothetical protein
MMLGVLNKFNEIHPIFNFHLVLNREVAGIMKTGSWIKPVRWGNEAVFCNSLTLDCLGVQESRSLNDLRWNISNRRYHLKTNLS